MRIPRPNPIVRTPDARRQKRFFWSVIRAAGGLVGGFLIIGSAGFIASAGPQGLPIWPALVWTAMGLISIGVAYWSHRHIRRIRIADGLCRACGYDLSASGETCSECGEPATER
ncbi:MAG: hypothetical protein AB8G96_04595 [Phycisphaerales bacterium]